MKGIKISVASIFLVLFGKVVNVFGLKSHILMETMKQKVNFIKKEVLDKSNEHEVVFAVKQNNIDALDLKLRERSDPSSPFYQQWLSYEEVTALTLNDEGANTVKKWLKKNDIAITWESKRHHYIKAKASIATWETQLNTEFFAWEESESTISHLTGHVRTAGTRAGVQYVRAVDYSLPAELVPFVASVLNTVQAPQEIINNYALSPLLSSSDSDNDEQRPLVPRTFKRNLRSRELLELLSPADASRATQTTEQQNPQKQEEQLFGNRKNNKRSTALFDVTVPFLNTLYNIPPNITAPTGSTLRQSVVQMAEAHFSPEDLLLFQQTFGLQEKPSVSIGGRNTSDCNVNNCLEGNLDLQYISGIAQDTTSVFWYVDGSTDDPFLMWVLAAAEETDPPRSNSISWASYEKFQGVGLLDAFNTEALKLSVMGVTISVAAGDTGASGSFCGWCDTQQPFTVNNCPCLSSTNSSDSAWAGATGWTGKGYYPYFPATSPYVTAVGATMGPENGGPEIACQAVEGGVITSGGGFSTYYAQPSWQTEAVSNYFNGLSEQPAGGYNALGRAYPDVSLIGVNYLVMVAGSLTALFGTSASAPVFAGMISLVNAQRAQHGLPPVGFINPTLYAQGNRGVAQSPFNDVTEGNNRCSADCRSGFSAAVGWDPVTGWGSVDYPQLYGMFKNVTATPSAAPSNAGDTISPSQFPTQTPSDMPSAGPTNTVQPSATPTATPSSVPTTTPTSVPTATPTATPSFVPTVVPSTTPSATPSTTPSHAPSISPSSASPSIAPSATPTAAPSTTVPTQIPTPLPSVTPTFAPNMVLTTFNATMTISGVSLDTYNSDPAYEEVLLEVVTASMPGVQPSNIRNLLVTAAADVATSATSVRPSLSKASKRAAGVSVSAVSGVRVAFTVAVRSASLTFVSLAADLSSAVSSGAFGEALRSAAQEVGLTGFASAEASAVVVQCSEGCEEGSDGSGSNGEVLSVGAIAGIAVGGAALLILICSAAICWSRRSVDSTGSHSVAPMPTNLATIVPDPQGVISGPDVAQQTTSSSIDKQVTPGVAGTAIDLSTLDVSLPTSDGDTPHTVAVEEHTAAV